MTQVSISMMGEDFFIEGKNGNSSASINPETTRQEARTELLTILNMYSQVEEVIIFQDAIDKLREKIGDEILNDEAQASSEIARFSGQQLIESLSR